MEVFYIYVGSVLLSLILFYILRYVDEDFKVEFEDDKDILITWAAIPLANIILLGFLCKAIVMIHDVKNY